MKKNSAGTILWQRHPGDTTLENGTWPAAIATDPMGNCLLTGYNAGNFGSYNLPAGHLLAKYDMSGNVVWARSLNLSIASGICGIGTDAYGNSYIAGDYTDTLVSPPLPCFFVAKYDPNGNLTWLKKASGANSTATSIRTDVAGNCYLVGEFTGNLKFDNNADSLSSIRRDIFVYKLDSAGNKIWATQLGGNKRMWGFLISPDLAGNCYWEANSTQLLFLAVIPFRILRIRVAISETFVL